MKTIKKYLFLAAAVTMMASCSDNNYVGDNNPNSPDGSGAIAFGSGFKAVTRGNTTGAQAADLLNKKFVVSGFKGNGTTMSTVFDNYIVNWVESTAGTTASNTSDWEYVGIAAAAPSAITGNQTIKYWDYSTSQYDFAAYSLGTNTSITTGTPTSGQILVTSISPNSPYAPTYTLKGSAVDLAKCYISDMVTVEKANYQKEVQLTFRSLGTKIRVGLYETVPGYSVKEVKFYTDDATTTIAKGASATSATLFMPSGVVGFGSAGTYTVTFDNNNVAQVAFTMDGDATALTQKNFGSLEYKGKEGNETGTNIYLGRSSNDVSYAGSDYTTVLPNTATGDVLELRVDYTLVSIDGSGEEIKIHGAKAFVPATYTVWKPNYAYTYIFKISDNTNGWTSTTNTDPAGLYPITFDAIVADALDANNEQTTITTVASPSITTYQKDHDKTKDEYSAAKGKIYVQVMVDGSLKDDLGTKGHLYTVATTGTAISEATVLDALNIIETGTTGRNGITLTAETSTATITTIPGEDGNNISVNAGEAAEFTPVAPTSPATVKHYAYVYDTGEYTGEYYATAPTGWPTGYYTDAKCTTDATGDFAAGTYYKNTSTYIYTAVNTTSQPDDWATADVWYKDPDGTQPANGTAWASGYYYKKYTVNHKVYGVKVIKVVD